MSIDKSELLESLKEHLSLSISVDREFGFYPNDGKESVTLNIALNWYDEEKKESIIICSERVTL